MMGRSHRSVQGLIQSLVFPAHRCHHRLLFTSVLPICVMG